MRANLQYIMTFQDLGLKKEVLTAVEALGFETPSEIQQKAIPQLLTGFTDFVGLAQTGTGKTAAFGLPLAHLCNFNEKTTQAVIICPTRELCLQISKDLKTYTSKLIGSKVVAVYGGASIDTQWRELKRGAHIIVATPGRLIDFLGKKAIDLSTVQYVVLDEADEMLNMGFKDDIDEILEFTPHSKKTWLFSATMPKQVATIAKKFMDDPFEVTVGRKNESASTISHQQVSMVDRNRYFALKRLLDVNPNIYGIIFCNTRHHTREVAEKLMKDGYSADALHGDLSQAQRDVVMKKFRGKTLQMLVATDVAARGIDVDKLTHVIHYQLPDDIENYTHRSGRTGRAGREGISISLVSPRDQSRIRSIERIIKKDIELIQIPTGEEVCKVQLLSLINKVKETEVDHKTMDSYLPNVLEALEGLSKEEIVAKFVSTEFNRFLSYYKNSSDLNQDPSKAPARGGRDQDNADYQRFFINVGSLDDLDKGGLLRFICDSTGVAGGSVGRIDVKDKFSFFEVHKDQATGLVGKFEGSEHNGRGVRAEETDKSPGGGGGRDRGGRSGGGGGRERGGRSGGSGGGERNRYGSGSGSGSRARSGGGSSSTRDSGGDSRRRSGGGREFGGGDSDRGGSRPPRNKGGFRHN